MRVLLLTFAALLACSAPALAQQFTPTEKLTRSVVLLNEAGVAGAAYTQTEIDNIGQRQIEIQRLLESAQGGIPSEYLAAFEEYAQLLDEARNDRGATEAGAKVSFVARDLEAKLAFARSALSLTPSALLVELDIRTLRDGTEVRGLMIKCNPLGLGNRQPARHAFPAATPVKAGRLAPGYYLVFAYAGDVLVGQREVTIGLTGNRKELVDVVVRKAD